MLERAAPRMNSHSIFVTASGHCPFPVPSPSLTLTSIPTKSKHSNKQTLKKCGRRETSSTNFFAEIDTLCSDVQDPLEPAMPCSSVLFRLCVSEFRKSALLTLLESLEVGSEWTCEFANLREGHLFRPRSANSSRSRSLKGPHVSRASF